MHPLKNTIIRPPGLKWLVGALLPLFLIGCLENYGRLKPSTEVTRAFESIQILPDHHYYYTGPDYKPYAIMALQNGYRLQSRLWKPVDLDRHLLWLWVNSGMHADGEGFFPYGATIHDPKGKRVGIWYSVFDRTVVKSTDYVKIAVYPPLILPMDSNKPSDLLMK